MEGCFGARGGGSGMVFSSGPMDGSPARGLAGTILFLIPALWLALRLMYRRVVK